MVEKKPEGQRAAVVLGCMNFGKRTPAAEAERIVARAIERGVTAFDTANVYNAGESEKILGRALRGKRDRSFVATKVGLNRVGGKAEGLSKAVIERAIDESLRRLGTDHVDLYYLHAPDPAVPVEVSIEALGELQTAGKIRHHGVSNYASWQILEMMQACDARGIARPAASQVLYNLLIRQLDVEYFAFTRRYPLHTTVYNPLAGGLLSGKHRRSDAGALPSPGKGSRFEGNALYTGRYWSSVFFERVEAYEALAAEVGLSIVELSYAWLAGRPGVDSILVGPASLDHLDAAIDGCARALPAEVEARVDALHRAISGTDASYAR